MKEWVTYLAKTTYWLLLCVMSMLITKYIYRIIYKKHHSVCPLVGIGTPPTPLPQVSVPSPPDQKVGGTLARGSGDGGVPIPTTRVKT